MNLKTINFKQFKNTNKTIITKGDYIAKIDSIEQEENSDVIKIIWIIQDGEFAGTKIYCHFNLSIPTSLRVFTIMILHTGIDPEKLEDTKELVGRECKLRIVPTCNEFGDNNTIKKFLPIDYSKRSIDILCEELIQTVN